jgi:3',5'-cyclic AMP phosphodiesterase CpdA
MPTFIAQITDLHIKRPGERAYGHVDTETALRRLIETLNGLKPRPDLVVISGDLVDGGASAEYDNLTGLLEGLDLHFAVTAGNHDDRQAARAAFPRQPFAAGSALNQRRAVGPVDVFLLDSSVPGKPHGVLEAETLAWLEAELAAGDAERPALLFFHHPPFATGIWHMDRQPLTNADAFAALIGRHARIRLVATGHAHRAVFTRFAGVSASICPAPNHAVALDLDQSLAPSFRLEPPAFHLHVWDEGARELVTHLVPVGAFEGPHPFFSADGGLL